MRLNAQPQNWKMELSLNTKRGIALLLVAALFFALINQTIAAPLAPSLRYISNETAVSTSGTKINTSGGSVATVVINGTSQNLRWKAFVGNVTGKLSLDDAQSNTIYDWSLSSISGEVYATRFSGAVNWSSIRCAYESTMRQENYIMNHTSRDDNISATFAQKSHSQFYVGTANIAANSCYSIRTYVNSSPQSSRFEEILLYDGTAAWAFTQSPSNFRHVIYSTILEQDKYGFDNQTYDFQLIVPERGHAGWSSSTAYYFYAELS